MIKPVSVVVVIFLFCLVFSSSEESAYKVIEASTPGILGAILGGITAGLSIIFSVLLTVTSTNATNIKLSSFMGFISSLRTDVLALLACLVASLILPYLRITGIPLLNYPIHELLPDRHTFYTALELTAIVVSVAIIVEVFNVMFGLFKYFSKLGDESDPE
ncbi:hypothetical protein [Enterovibrio norvegicus]|uniref:Uncharacterized protein n=1 Tax=Enterovibrio norvegicus TaxID=188144 RepID=A0A2N7LDG0_9GAMM|nr:hypothetical protein [Enterovibrio norvegicus]PMI34466.1 hypothetical protein BCU47_06335 [Enterovibrio norvegicus]PML81495.1 hypothetical protein BCT69_07365 [Enterovibrio norvegicus]PMN93410.1 hypothetical protein BCT23_13450 [Enterovibrio norvegicus]